jgi:hypothetical protein
MKQYLIICLILVGESIYANSLSDKQISVIYNEAIKVLYSFQQISNEMADNVFEMNELNKSSQKFIDLFVSRKSIIFNDLDPTYNLSETYELETYVANMLLWYPDGMKANLDLNNLKAGNIIAHGNDVYTVDILTSKKINGNYLNKQKNNNTEELLFRIAFYQKNRSFENYRIAGIRSTKATTVADDSKLLAEVRSVNFPEKDVQIIKDQTRNILNDYINFLTLLTDPKESDDDKYFYRLSFLGLFNDTTLRVANDIEPEPLSRWIPISEYQRNIINYYPEGVRNIGMNIDSTEYGRIIPEGGNKFYISGYVDKFFAGRYMNKTIHRDYSKYDIRISFEKDENTFRNFKISSIDKLGVDLYEESASTARTEIPNKRITTLKRKGIYAGLAIGGGTMTLTDKNLEENPILNWSIQGKSTIQLEGVATWYLTNRIGVSTGISYNSNVANTSLSGNFQNNTYSTDINNELYLKTVSASYDSLINMKYISIPLTLIFHTNSNPEKWGVYIETGVVTSINLNSSYHVTGNFATSGYYEQYPSSMQILNNPELGYVTRNNIDIQGKTNISTTHFSFRSSIGVTWPINYFTTIYFGPEINISLNNISNLKEFTDAFGTKSDGKNVGLSKYGIKFGISYKL